MGEQVYPVGERRNKRYLRFAEDSGDWQCLCTWPGNYAGDYKAFDASVVRSLALLGAALALAVNAPEELNSYDDGTAFLPFAVPEWIREGIKRAVPVEEGEHG